MSIIDIFELVTIISTQNSHKIFFKNAFWGLIMIICKLAKSMHIWDITNPIWRSSRRLKGLIFCVERYDSKILPPQGKSWGCGSTFGGQLRSILLCKRHLSATSYVFHPSMLHPTFHIFYISSSRLHLCFSFPDISTFSFNPQIFNTCTFKPM